MKELLDGYVGIKFAAVCTDGAVPDQARALYPDFRGAGDRLRRHRMAPANGGNLSQLCDEGMAITTSGCNLGHVDEAEVALVRGCSLERERVTYAGAAAPSSEAMMHWLIYRDFPEARAVVHAHDELATSSAAASRLSETPREEPYGTVALARLAVETFAGGGRIIVLKNHGYVAFDAEDLAGAVDTVTRMHLCLLEALDT